MRITKIDGISHYKMKESGTLKESKVGKLSKDLTEEKIREIVKKVTGNMKRHCLLKHLLILLLRRL